MLLTEKGKKKKEISKKTVKDFNKIIVDKYSPAQLELFHEMLDDITAIAIETKFNNK
jgi:hypothetical protein